VYVFFSTCLSTCVLRAVCFVCDSVSITTFCFLSPFSTNLIDTYVTVLVDVRTNLRICLNSFSIHIFISLLPTYVYMNMYMHFPPLLYSYILFAIFKCMFCSLNMYIHFPPLLYSYILFAIFICMFCGLNMYMHFSPLLYSYILFAIFICMFCGLFYIHNHLFLFSFLFQKSDRHLCHGAYQCMHDPAHIPRLPAHLYLHFFNSCKYVSKNLLTFSLLFHIRTHLSICSCVWFV